MQINIEKRLAMLILGIVLLLAGALVYAYGTSSPATFGHSLGELGIRESGYSIFLENATGASYRDCKTTCNNEMIINTTGSTTTCYSYSDGEKTSTFAGCPSGKVECGNDVFDLYCAKKNAIPATNIGKILVN